MAEWTKAAVLKTVEGQPSGGSNPSLSAKDFLFVLNKVRIFAKKSVHELAFQGFRFVETCIIFPEQQYGYLFW